MQIELLKQIANNICLSAYTERVFESKLQFTMYQFYLIAHCLIRLNLDRHSVSDWKTIDICEDNRALDFAFIQFYVSFFLSNFYIKINFLIKLM